MLDTPKDWLKRSFRTRVLLRGKRWRKDRKTCQSLRINDVFKKWMDTYFTFITFKNDEEEKLLFTFSV